MSKAHYSFTQVIALTAIFSATLGASEEFYRNHLPTGVVMEMSPKELATARPAARKNDFLSGGTLDMFELRRERNSASVFSYRFKAGKLGAVLESTKTTMLPFEHTQAAAGKLAEELRGNFVLQHEDQIVRSANAVAAVLTAQLWEDKTKGLNLYFVATNQEITLVVFDPKAFGKGDFFNGLELLKKVEANNESIRRTLGKSAAPSLQIIDLLATQKTDNVTPPPADAPPAVSAPSSPTTESADAVVALPDTHPPMQAGKQKAPLWPWIAGGILVLILIVALALKRRAQ